MLKPDTLTADDALFMYRVLAVTGFENTDDLWWRLGETGAGEADVLSLYLMCNDVFFWGSGDLEQITPEDVDALEQAYADAQAATGDRFESGAILFVARKRGQRPQGAMYKHLDVRLWASLNACGPHREAALGNPTPTPATPALKDTATAGS